MPLCRFPALPRLARALPVAALLAFAPALAPAQSFWDTLVELTVGPGEEDVGLEAGTPNTETRGPEALSLLLGDAADGSQDELILLDPVRRRILRLRRSGEVLGAIDLEGAVEPVDVKVFEDVFYVLDRVTRRILGYERDGEPAGTYPIPDAGTGGGLTIGSGDFSLSIDEDGGFRVGIGGNEIRFDRERGEIEEAAGTSTVATVFGGTESVERRTAEGAIALELSELSDLRAGTEDTRRLEIRTEGFLAGVRLVGRDEDGAFYVLTDRLEGGIDVVTELRRYAPDGRLAGIAPVPLGEAVHVPANPVTVAPDGSAFALVPKSGSVEIVELVFADPDGPTDGLREGRDESVPEDLPEAFGDRINEEAEDEGLRSSITRDEIIANAEAFLEVEWTLAPENYARQGTPSECSPGSGRVWRRPERLEGRQGQTIAAAPYKWGGYMAVDTMIDRLEEGALAGDVCTCRSAAHNWCLHGRGSAGVDCSGFVSQTWAAAYHTTSRMGEITRPLDGWLDVRPGDAANRRGAHIRLITGLTGLGDGGGSIRVHAIESSVSGGGVHRAVYTLGQLRKYRPIRYLYVED